jgi:hypothetical protein
MTPAQKLLALIVALPLAHTSAPLAKAAVAVDASSWTNALGTPTNSSLAADGVAWGNNTANNADNTAIHATLDADTGTAGNQPVTLAEGDTVTFSGTVEFKGLTSSTGTIQFRYGLFDVNGKTNTNGWLGYFVGNNAGSGAGSAGGGIYERSNPNTALHVSTTGAPQIRSATAVGGSLTSETFTFSLTLVRSAAGITISSSLIRVRDSLNFAAVTGFLDTTPQTFTFNRVAFLAGNNIDADQVILSNLALTGTTIPDVIVDTDSDGLDDNWETARFGNLDQIGTGDPDGDTFSNEDEETAGSNPTNNLSTPLDKDSDGLPDAWEVTHFGNAAAQNGSGDPDGDLATNAAEFAAGSSPVSSTSWPDTDSDTLNDAWEVLYFGAINAANATPLANPDADAFDNKAENDGFSDPTNLLSVPGDIDGDGLADTWEITHFTNLTAQNGSGDPDADRATNEEEETAGSNPKDKNAWPDADGDFLNDAWETFYFGNTAAQDGAGDPDGDTFSNDAEHFYNFSPIDPFSSPDLDTDGLADGWEVFYFTNTIGDGSSDTDSDGFNDTFEFGLRTNPTLATSFPGDLDGNGINDGPVLRPTGDVINTTSFAAALNWHNGQAPVAGQTYIVDGTSANGGGLRTSTTNADYTFAGDRIVFINGANLITKHTGGLTFTLAEFNGSTINQATNTPPGALTLNGAVQINGTAASNFWANNGTFVINATVSGPADLNLTGNQLVTFNGALTGTGDLIVAAHTTAPATNRLNLSAASSLTFTLGNASATNTISGNGAVSLNGAFVINNAAVTDTTVGNSWSLVSTTGAKTYGSTFSVSGYTSDGATAGTRKWTSTAAPFFQFDEATGSLSIVTNPDSDGDGLADSWEITHFTDLGQNGTGDFDGDLATNAAELAAGTLPTDNTSWPDTDADGVNDAFEIATFGDLTTATITDKDGDTLLDAWETVYFGNTTAATAASGDNDADGASNAQEFAAGSDPDDAASKPTDTDGDGILDVNEAVKPYTVDADTLHLWHLDETSAPFANAVNTAHNLQGMHNGAIAWTPSLGGFGTSVNTNSGTTPNLGIVTYAPTINSAVTGDTATPADPAFVWQGTDGTFTLEAVVKFDSLPTTWTSHGHLITMDGDGALTEDRVFQFRIDTSNPAAPALQFQRLNGTTQSIATALPLTGDHAVDTTSWFHVAVTYDGNAGTAGNMKLYWTKVVPGTAAANLLGSGSLTSDFPAGIQGDLSLGNEARSSGGSTEPFCGTIDEVRISSIARADSGFLFAATATAAPTELVATAGVNSVALSWTASPGATTYSIKRSTVSGGTPSGTYDTLSAGAVTGTTYTDTTALNGTTYYYVISAVATGESPNSTEVSATPRSAFQTWALGQGLTLGVNDGPAQDPENDGLANLLEYATGTTNNPLAATANPVTVTSIVNGSSNRVLRLDFPRVNDPALTYVVRATSDLATAFADVASYPASSTPVQHEDSVTLAPGVRRFLRLEIRQN